MNNITHILYIVDKVEEEEQRQDQQEKKLQLALVLWTHSHTELKHVGSSHSDFIASNF